MLVLDANFGRGLVSLVIATVLAIVVLALLRHLPATKGAIPPGFVGNMVAGLLVAIITWPITYLFVPAAPGRDQAARGTATSQSALPDQSTPAVTTKMPSGYAGTWKGTLQDPNQSHPILVTLSDAGSLGESVGAIQDLYWNCKGDLKLKSVTAQGIELLETGSSCACGVSKASPIDANTLEWNEPSSCDGAYWPPARLVKTG